MPTSAGFLLRPGDTHLSRETAEHHVKMLKLIAREDTLMTNGPVKEAVAELVELHRSATAIAVRLEHYIVEHNRRLELRRTNPIDATTLLDMSEQADSEHWTTSTMLAHASDLRGVPLNLLVNVLSFADKALRRLHDRYPRAVERKYFPLGDGDWRMEWHAHSSKRQHDDDRDIIQILNAEEIPERERPTTLDIVQALDGRADSKRIKSVRQQAKRIRDQKRKREENRLNPPPTQVRIVRRAKYVVQGQIRKSNT